jgi:hypothetical protein
MSGKEFPYPAALPGERLGGPDDDDDRASMQVRPSEQLAPVMGKV